MAFVERPGYVQVGNHLFGVEWCTPDEWQRHNEDPGSDGVTRAAVGVIRMQLVPERPESFYQETLAHELLHVAFDNSGATHISLDGVEDAEENLCLMLGPQVLGILKANPHVAKYLMSDGKVVR